jgi:hypothetical protein
LYSVYWSLTTLTTVGYGDIVAKNDAERLYALCCMVIGAILFGYLMSTVADLLRSYDMNKVMMQRGIDEVRDFLRYHKFSPEMTGRVKRYFEFYHCSCRRGALCVHALRLQACRSESEPGRSNAIC